MAKPLIPFNFMPGSWGLKGKTREIAKAEYELSGYELEVKLALLNLTKEEFHRHLNEIDYRYGKKIKESYRRDKASLTLKDLDFEIEINDINLEFHHINHETHKRNYANLTLKDNNLLLELAKIDIDYGRITQKEYDKTVKTLNGEEYIDVKLVLDENNCVTGEFILDWNDIFIMRLRKDGNYRAAADEDVMSLWLTDICRTVALEDLNGTGTFSEDSEQSMENKQENIRKANRVKKSK